jgi:hypothetical protein
MRSVLSLAIFAAWALCFVVFMIKLRPISINATPSAIEQVGIR